MNKQTNGTADAILAASIAGNSYALWHCAGRTDAPPTFATDAERDAYRAAYEETQANEAAALERARTAPAIVPNVHVMATSGEPTGAHYNETQMNGDIRDGDVLIIGETVAILDRAWPVAIVGPCGAFHAIGDGAGDDVCDADRARSGRAPLAPIIARIRAGEFSPAAPAPVRGLFRARVFATGDVSEFTDAAAAVQFIADRLPVAETDRAAIVASLESGRVIPHYVGGRAAEVFVLQRPAPVKPLAPAPGAYASNPYGTSAANDGIGEGAPSEPADVVAAALADVLDAVESIDPPPMFPRAAHEAMNRAHAVLAAYRAAR